MSERYATLYRCTVPQAQTNAPIILTAGVLLGDKQTGSVLAQIKLQNISEKTISAVYASLMCVDAMNMAIDSAVDARYLDLNVKPGEYFADRQPIVLSNTTVRSFTLRVTDIMYADGTVWHNDDNVAYAEIPEIRSIYTSEQLEQLRIETGKREFVTSETVYGDLKRCCCGQWNASVNATCVKCNTDFSKLAEVSNPVLLTTKYEERKRMEVEANEQARIAREKDKAEREQQAKEEERRREKQRQIEEKRILAAKKKKKKALWVFAVVAVLAIAVVGVVTKIVIPNNYYEQAVVAFNNRMFVEAYESFILAEDYKDSTEQAKCSAYNYAQVLFEQENYEQAYIYYQMAEGYSDSADKKTAIALLYAQKLHEQCDYQDASTWYNRAGASDMATVMSNFHYATNSERNWLHSDTREKAKALPDGVFLFTTTISTGKYSKETTYGVLKTGDEGWITDHSNYTYVHYYQEHDIVLAGTDTMCTIIDLRTNSMADVLNVNEVEYVSDEGIVCFYRSDSGYGYFDRVGCVFVEPKYQRARAFSEGFAAVRKDGLWGFIDNSGKEVIDFRYTDVESFSNGYAKVEMEEHRVKEGDLYVSYNEGWGLIDTCGVHVVEPNWYEIDYSEEYLREGVVLVKDRSSWDYGLVDLNNNIVLEPQYDSISIAAEGLFYVRTLEKGESYYPCTNAGFVDADGNMVINLLTLGIDGPREDDGTFINGCAVISYWKKGGWSRDICDLVINSSGQIVWQGENDDWSAYQSNNGDIQLSFYGKVNGEYIHQYKYYKTQDGKMIAITEAEFTQRRNQQVDSYWLEEASDKAIELDTAFYKQWASVSSFSDEGIALVSLSAKGPYGYVTDKEKLLVDAIYEDARSFVNGYAIVKANGKWGCIDTNGNTIIQPQYQLVSSVSPDGTLFVQYDDGSYALINLRREAVIEDIQSIDNSEGNIDGELPMPSNCVFIRTKTQDKWQLFDSQGNQIF